MTSLWHHEDIIQQTEWDSSLVNWYYIYTRYRWCASLNRFQMLLINKTDKVISSFSASTWRCWSERPGAEWRQRPVRRCGFRESGLYRHPAAARSKSQRLHPELPAARPPRRIQRTLPVSPCYIPNVSNTDAAAVVTTGVQLLLKKHWVSQY